MRTIALLVVLCSCLCGVSVAEFDPEAYRTFLEQTRDLTADGLLRSREPFGPYHSGSTSKPTPTHGGSDVGAKKPGPVNGAFGHPSGCPESTFRLPPALGNIPAEQPQVSHFMESMLLGPLPPGVPTEKGLGERVIRDNRLAEQAIGTDDACTSVH
jgi:hypothetical protein